MDLTHNIRWGVYLHETEAKQNHTRSFFPDEQKWYTKAEIRSNHLGLQLRVLKSENNPVET